MGEIDGRGLSTLVTISPEEHIELSNHSICTPETNTLY